MHALVSVSPHVKLAKPPWVAAAQPVLQPKHGAVSSAFPGSSGGGYRLVAVPCGILVSQHCSECPNGMENIVHCVWFLLATVPTGSFVAYSASALLCFGILAALCSAFV